MNATELLTLADADILHVLNSAQKMAQRRVDRAKRQLDRAIAKGVGTMYADLAYGSTSEFRDAFAAATVRIESALRELAVIKQAGTIRTDNTETLRNALAENEVLRAELGAIKQAAGKGVTDEVVRAGINAYYGDCGSIGDAIRAALEAIAPMFSARPGVGYFRDNSGNDGYTEPNHPTAEPSIILRSDLDAIRKVIQEDMLKVPDMPGSRRVETCLQLDSGRKDYGWLYARHADGQWVTIAKLDGFSISMIQHEANAWWQRMLDRAIAATASAEKQA